MAFNLTRPYAVQRPRRRGTSPSRALDAVLCSNAFLAVTFTLDNVVYTLSGTNMSDVATRRAARFDRQTDAAC